MTSRLHPGAVIHDVSAVSRWICEQQVNSQLSDTNTELLQEQVQSDKQVESVRKQTKSVKTESDVKSTKWQKTKTTSSRWKHLDGATNRWCVSIRQCDDQLLRDDIMLWWWPLIFTRIQFELSGKLFGWFWVFFHRCSQQDSVRTAPCETAAFSVDEWKYMDRRKISLTPESETRDMLPPGGETSELLINKCFQEPVISTLICGEKKANWIWTCFHQHLLKHLNPFVWLNCNTHKLLFKQS